jgi:PhzF family phenazine biosynthesis protein
MICSNIKIYHVDAFTESPFGGNPAVVCIAEGPMEELQMQSIAREMNLSETAFVNFCYDKERYEIRWFTPRLEVDLCGHATMAAAKVLYDRVHVKTDCLVFNSRSGELRTFRQGDEIMLDFPLDELEQEISCSAELLEAIGIRRYVKAFIGRKTRKLVIHIEESEQVQLIKPDFAKLAALSFDTVVKGIGITAKGTGKYDIIGRYFNPWAGVNEDPVTGSVHTLLADYWSKLLNKNELIAYQASERGGEMRIRLADSGRVELWGKAVIVTAGELLI